MAKKKKQGYNKGLIAKGPFRGLNQISEDEFIQQETTSKAAMEIPTQNKVVTVGRKVRNLTPDWCKNGDMDRCPAPCGACLDNLNAGSLKVRKAKIVQVLDMLAYSAQNRQVRLILN